MSDSRNPIPAHKWADVQKLGVLKSVTSIAEYERLISIGSLLAEKYIAEFSPNCFQLDACETVHRLLFEEVYPWAGEFRSSGQTVIIAGYPGADAWRIVRELQLLEIQTDIFANCVSQLSLDENQTHALVCAFHHLRFERIHPFRDGNGRVGRLLMAGAVREFRRTQITFDWSNLKEKYFTALKIGNKGELAPLANLILDVCNDREPLASIKSPFRVSPRMFEAITEIDVEEDLDWSIVPSQ